MSLSRTRSGLAVALLALCGGARAGHALPVISEVFYDASGSDDGHSFVELFAAAGSVLDGLTLEGVNGAGGAVGPVVALSGVVGADGLFVVADATGIGSSFVSHFDLLANFDFQNGPDSIVLRSPAAVLDAVGYGSFGAGDVFAGEGNAAPDAPAGSSLARRFADLDSDDNAFDFAVLASPTPGTAEWALPEPAPALMLGGGLAGLLAWSRRRERRA
ncbi:MAG: hypothetical protein VX681_15130 [Myxococcota bacterium]|nr:hypothetical protein [Myxococcota bacterium]